jgi:hypothetical protein
MSASWIHKLNESDSRLHKEDVIRQALEAAILGSTNAINFLPELKTFYLEEVRTKTGDKRKDCFGSEKTAIKNFFNSIGDELQRKYAVNESGVGLY